MVVGSFCYGGYLFDGMVVGYLEIFQGKLCLWRLWLIKDGIRLMSTSEREEMKSRFWGKGRRD